jgi:prophage antirepressor-like protein
MNTATFIASSGYGTSTVHAFHDGMTKYFLLSDVAYAAGLKSDKHRGYGKHLDTLLGSEVCKGYDLNISKGVGNTTARWVTESGMYKILAQGDKAKADVFQRFLAEDVQPRLGLKIVQTLMKRAKGLEENHKAGITVQGYCTSKGLNLTNEQKIKLGRVSRLLADVAGRETGSGKVEYQREIKGKQVTLKYPVALHTFNALDRAAHALGYLA